MKLQDLQMRALSGKKKSLIKEYQLLEELIAELQARELPPEVVVNMNIEISRLNAVVDDHIKLYFYVKLVKKKLLKSILKDLEIVPKNYYRNFWLAMGMSVIGIPFGALFSMLLDNYSYISFGMLIGMVLGLAIGTELDKKALENNRQLQLEIN